MEAGTIVKAAFLQADRQIKFRPAVMIKSVPPFGDFLVCAVSTQNHLFVPGLDIKLEEGSSDFAATRLFQSSIIRSGMLATLPSNMIQGAIDKISQPLCEQLLQQLRSFL